jgi:hypothetical protein
MHLHQETALAYLVDALRLDARIKQLKLIRPIGTHSFLPMDVSTLHSVRPLNVWMHEREHGIDTAGIEIPVSTH